MSLPLQLQVKKGTTSKRLSIMVYDTSSTAGASGLTGLVFNSSGIKAYYWREDAGNTGGVAISLVTATLGTWTSGGFKEKDATNMPGMYELSIPDAALATGAEWVTIMLFGVTNMGPVAIEIQLVDYVTIKKNQALASFPFSMVTPSGTKATGVTVTATRSIDGGAFASCANAVAEVANGWYKISLAASDLNGNTIALYFTGSGARDSRLVIITQP